MAKPRHQFFTSASIALFLLFSLAPSFLYATPGTSFSGWEHLYTAHFEIIYEPQDRQTALEAAAIADDVYDRVSSLLGHTPGGYVPLIIAGRTATANGFYSPMPDRIAIYTTSPSTRFMGSRTTDWIRSVLTHELTHYIHLTAPVGPAGLLSQVFGPALTSINMAFMPGWWVEGITTYTETELAIGGRGDSPLFALAWEAPIAEGRMWSIGQSAYQSALPPSGRIYSSGYLLVDYLADTYGPDIFAKVNSSFANLPFLGMSAALGRTIDINGPSLMKAAIERVQEEHETPGARNGQPFSASVTGDFQLPEPTDIGLIGLARTLRDGQVFISYESASGTLDIDSASGYEIISHTATTDALSWDVASDGKQIVFASAYSDPGQAASSPSIPVSWSDLYLLDTATLKTRKLTTEKRLVHPTISDDGTRIAALEVTGSRYRLVSVDNKTGETAVLWDPEGISLYEPRWSSDGTQIACIAIQDGTSALFLYSPLDGKAIQVLPWSPAELHRPRYTPQGDILFGSDADGRLEVFKLDPDTTSIFKLTTDSVGAFGAVLIPGGLLYATYTADGYALRLVQDQDIQATLFAWNAADKTRQEDPTEATTQKTVDIREGGTYGDIPRFCLWLPLPVNDKDKIIPGATAVFSSILGHHLVQATAAWSIDDSVPMANLTSGHVFPWASISANIGINTSWYDYADHTYKREYFVGGSASIPLARWPQPASITSLQGNASTEFHFRTTGLETESALAISLVSRDASSALQLYGKHLSSMQTGAILSTDQSEGIARWYPFVETAVQIPVGRNGFVLRGELSGIATSDGDIPNEVLLPRGDAPWSWGTGQAKGRASLLFRIPLGLLDQPIPFGGILGSGLTVFAQTAGYIDNGATTWDGHVQIGLELDLDWVIGALDTTRSTAGVIVGLPDGNWKVYFKFGIDSSLL